jgi:hypothetical protein
MTNNVFTMRNMFCPYKNLKDQRGDQRGGEWEPNKIPQRNLAYIPKSTQSHNNLNPAALKPSLAVEKTEAKTENNQ